MMDILGFYSYNDTSRPMLVIIDKASETREDYSHATDEVLEQVCQNYQLNLERLRGYILGMQPNTHTVMINLDEYRKNEQQTGHRMPETLEELSRWLGNSYNAGYMARVEQEKK